MKREGKGGFLQGYLFKNISLKHQLGEKIKGRYSLEIRVSANFIKANHRLEKAHPSLGAHSVFIIITQPTWVTKMILLFLLLCFFLEGRVTRDVYLSNPLLESNPLLPPSAPPQ